MATAIEEKVDIEAKNSYVSEKVFIMFIIHYLIKISFHSIHNFCKLQPCVSFIFILPLDLADKGFAKQP
jgi:hypothetical protein